MALLPNQSRCSFPFAARGDQPIGHQNLENLVPARPFPARRQTLGPEPIQLQLAPQLTGQPAGAPLPRPAQRQRRETNSHRRPLVDRRAAILGEQRQGPRLAGRLVEDLDRLAPGRGLRPANLSQIEDLPLHHPAIVEAPILDDVPIDVRLAVFLASALPQKHDSANLGAQTRPWEWGRSSPQPISPILGFPVPAISIACARAAAQKSLLPPANPRSRARPDSA